MSKRLHLLVLLAVSALLILPLLCMVNTSLKSLGEILTDPPRFWPAKFRYQNYVTAFATFPLGRYLANTLFLCLARVAGVLASSVLVAWGFARYKSRWNTPLFLLCLATMMLPPQVTAIPVFTMFLRLGFYNTYVPLILPLWLATNAFFIFLLKQFFEAIPNDLLDAARIEGCSEFRVLWYVGIPLSKPILWTVAVFTFIGSWNDYFGPLIYLTDEHRYPLSLGLTYFLSASRDAEFGTQWNLMMAVSLVTMLPAAVLFFFAQRSFIDNAMAGGVKQ